jgi:hypothetical protein
MDPLDPYMCQFMIHVFGFIYLFFGGGGYTLKMANIYFVFFFFVRLGNSENHV